MQEFYLRLVRLPLHVEAAVLPNDDGTFDIYVNESLPEEQRRRAFDHEVRHIRLDHLYRCDPVALGELEADGKQPVCPPPPAAIPAPEQPPEAACPPGPIPAPPQAPRRELRLPQVTRREREYAAALSRRLNAEWARDPAGTHARLEDRWLFDVR